MLPLHDLDMSLTYSRYNRGPRIESCETPECIFTLFDDLPSIYTHRNTVLNYHQCVGNIPFHIVYIFTEFIERIYYYMYMDPLCMCMCK